MQFGVGRVPAGFEPALKHLKHSAAEDRYQEVKIIKSGINSLSILQFIIVSYHTAKLATQALKILYNTPVQSVRYYLESLHVY